MKNPKLLWPILFSLTLMMAASILADAPALMSYQGRLTDSLGNPLDTTVNMTFTIYDNRISGNPLWTELQPSVAVSGGVFHIRLGKAQSLSQTVFADTVRWLGVKVGNDSEISPRTQLVAVPWSYRVATIDSALGGTIKGNLVIEEKATVGITNYNSGSNTFCAGSSNTTAGDFSSICGGFDNYAYGEGSNVGGGISNAVSGNYACIPGGKGNQAAGDLSFAAGNNAIAAHTGSIVLAANECDT